MAPKDVHDFMLRGTRERRATASSAATTSPALAWTPPLGMRRNEQQSVELDVGPSGGDARVQVFELSAPPFRGAAVGRVPSRQGEKLGHQPLVQRVQQPPHRLLVASVGCDGRCRDAVERPVGSGGLKLDGSCEEPFGPVLSRVARALATIRRRSGVGSLPGSVSDSRARASPSCGRKMAR
jgi:hypothetical protein